jgi:hypothetical protein
MALTWMKAGVGLMLWGGVCVGIAAREATAFEQQEAQAQEESSAERNPRAEEQICDRSEILELEQEAMNLVRTDCPDVSLCRTAPVGALACGGPRDYVVYCAATTPEQELLRALARLERREERFNRQCDVVSICIFIPPPPVELVDGQCQVEMPDPDPLP